ncbi:MAG: Arm DNA-binding domain-containing protein [Gammaproteobacteria bacterium]
MLTETCIRAAKPGKKAMKLFDGGGLYLLLHPNGSKYWRLKYRHTGKEKNLRPGRLSRREPEAGAPGLRRCPQTDRFRTRPRCRAQGREARNRSRELRGSCA